MTTATLEPLATPGSIDRNNGLGASDAAPALGESKYKTPLGLYLEKVGLAPPVVENEPMRWGTLLQDTIIAEFCRRIGKQLARPETRLQHPDHPWMWATIDGQLDDGTLVEAKTCGVWSADEFGESGTDDLPAAYVLQASHQMAVTGATLCLIPVLIAGQELRSYRVERNELLIERLIDLEGTFWRRVENRDPPPSQLPRDVRLLDLLHPLHNSVAYLDEDAQQLVASYRDSAEHVKHHEKNKEQAKAMLIELMAGASLAQLPDGRTITRKTVNRAGYSVEPSTYVNFTIKEPKTKGQ